MADVRASADEALLFLVDVRRRLKIVSLTEDDYTTLLDAAAANGIVGESDEQRIRTSRA